MRPASGVPVLMAALGLALPAAARADTPPAPPVLSAPAAGATGVPTTPGLRWLDGGGARSYDVEVALAPAARTADGRFVSPVARRTGLGSTSWTVGPALQLGKHYVWHVIARNKAGTSSWSADRDFQTTQWQQKRLSGPSRTEVRDAAGNLVATFTDGSWTVTLTGPERSFSERTATYPVVTTAWVRQLPRPFAGVVDEAWLASALADSAPDVLAIAIEYVEGAPRDASYGPLQPDGTRQEGSDFNDYLGVAWTYPDGFVDQPEAHQLGSLDCSGYIRMIWGHRGSIPLVLDPDGRGLPRRAVQQAASAPGVVTVSNSGKQVTDFSRLRAGDLVFFDASSDDGTNIDHVGMYLGADTAGNHRFISSRKSIDGPTLGDYAGKSILNGSGLYASSFRSVRRL